MKAVILAGGLGTRISEETHLKPKPMIEIGGKPILWHIMKNYSHYGINDFIICCGYKGYLIKEYFYNYSLHLTDITINTKNNQTWYHDNYAEDWNVTLVDTGENTLTGGRLKRIARYLDNGDDFCLTYGDGVGDVNIANVIKEHQKSGKLATVTATQLPGRFGAISVDGNRVKSFKEKPKGDGSWISAGFFVLSRDVIDRIDGDDCIWEEKPMQSLADDEQFSVYFHEGFWQPMDTLRDKIKLEELWNKSNAPWKTWS
ncbi:MAG: glucose-1-phosphate cytidylyltransferase [Rickettsiales bacterium]|nr:glucose-1-phosphate cytidylyltransferase [Rickettsiales bacterium]|tara:strand:- start:523 stop:1296 length:774 start_codon:yes stop_codon:yes gene_type:complete